MTDLAQVFLDPANSAQRRYEMLRACFVDNEPLQAVAERFGYSYGTVRNLCSEFRRNPTPAFFMPAQRGKKKDPENASTPTRRKTSEALQQRTRSILSMRAEKNLSAVEIAATLRQKGQRVSDSTVMRTLRLSGVAKLHRRTLQQRLDAPVPQRAAVANYRKLDLAPRQFQTDFGGLFLFVHDLARLQLDTLLMRSKMPGSQGIPAGCAVRALLALKLWGLRRSAHVMAEVLDPGLALFAGLNVMPKRSTLSEYSCRVHPEQCTRLMEAWHTATRSLDVCLGQGQSFDLDFHTIPYHGDDVLLQKHYVSKRSRSQKGILSLVVRDAEARLFVYADAQVRKENRHDQLQHFVDWWHARSGTLPKELVFDSTFTTYANLAQLTAQGIDFLTLRRRSQKMLATLAQVPPDQWRRIRLHNVGRTFRHPRILEQKVRIRGYPGKLRQIAITELGHEKPTLLLTNQMHGAASRLIDRYARRMLIENTLADAIDFFHMDALSAAVPLKIDVDLQLTLMASTLYRILAKRIGNGMENAKPRTLFRKLVRTRAKVEIQADDLIVTLPRRANSPYLLAAGYNDAVEAVPWLGDRRLHIRIA